MKDTNDYCNACGSCDSCSACDACNSCNSCYACYSCYSCGYCNACGYCNSCDSCSSCVYCKNLRLTEFNLFCYSTTLNGEQSCQQDRYRAFNKVVGMKRYEEIQAAVTDIIGHKAMELSEYWKQVTPEQWGELLAIPEARDFKDGFEYISGVKIELPKTECNPLLVKADELEAMAKQLRDAVKK